jgi:hypothetical protein
MILTSAVVAPPAACYVYKHALIHIHKYILRTSKYVNMHHVLTEQAASQNIHLYKHKHGHTQSKHTHTHRLSKRHSPLNAASAAQLAMLLDVYAACVRLHAMCAAMHPGVAALPGMAEQLGGGVGEGAVKGLEADRGSYGATALPGIVEGLQDGQGSMAVVAEQNWGYFQPIFNAAGAYSSREQCKGC